MEEKLRHGILLDPDPLWLDAVEVLLRGVGIEIVGKATAPEEALALARSLRPSLLVAEIDFPRRQLEGLAVVREARADVPEMRTIVLSQSDDPEHISAAFTAGATAYVVKTGHPDDLAVAARQAFDQSLFFANGQPPATAQPADTEPLTRREAEILALAAEGRSNAQLARDLWVTEQTVKFHLSNVYRKLGVSNRTEASRWAQLRGLVPSTAAPATGGPDEVVRPDAVHASSRRTR